MTQRRFMGMTLGSAWFSATFVMLIGLSLFSCGDKAGGWDSEKAKLIGSIVVSVVLGGVAIAIIFVKQDPSDRQWAYATLGTIAGFWLPSPL
jgi:membrane protein DedA with SNARE-associated domain